MTIGCDGMLGVALAIVLVRIAKQPPSNRKQCMRGYFSRRAAIRVYSISPWTLITTVAVSLLDSRLQED